MPAPSFIEPMESMLNGKCKYEYYDYQSNEFSITRKSRILHVEMPETGDMNSDIVVLTFTIRNQNGKWKIHSEGVKRQDPGAMVPMRNTALKLARANGWKFIAVAVAGADADDDIITQYVVGIESYTYGNDTVYDLSNELDTLKEQGCPNFYRTQISIRDNVYPLVFIKKEHFIDYLVMFDDRPYQAIFKNITDNVFEELSVIQECTCEDLTAEDLGKILLDMYKNANNKTTAIHMFGFKYAPIIKEKGYSAVALVSASGIGESYHVEVSKGIRIYEAILDNEYGISFYNGEEVKEELVAEQEVQRLPHREARTVKIHPLNAIIYGAPGTGKTYSTAEYAQAIIEGISLEDFKAKKLERKVVMDNYNNLVESKQIVFTTFHQSYGYEEFIQGLRPDTTSNSMSFKTVDGVFKCIADKAMADPDNNYVIIIDEINRANISKVFGELITLIEDDKRWGEINQTSATLQSGDLFAVPNNLYIIGTMNSADKSISLIDAALRRRFEFIEQKPDSTLVTDPTMRDVLVKLNTALANQLDSADLLIGHSYFIGKTAKDLPKVLNNSIIPLLYEYFYDNKKKVASVLNDAIKEVKVDYVVEDDKLGRIFIERKK